MLVLVIADISKTAIKKLNGHSEDMSKIILMLLCFKLTSSMSHLVLSEICLVVVFEERILSAAFNQISKPFLEVEIL